MTSRTTTVRMMRYFGLNNRELIDQICVVHSRRSTTVRYAATGLFAIAGEEIAIALVDVSAHLIESRLKPLAMSLLERVIRGPPLGTCLYFR